MKIEFKSTDIVYKLQNADKAPECIVEKCNSVVNNFVANQIYNLVDANVVPADLIIGLFE